ncbi:carcinoembryonic antigen-related cell adhesion molecule 1 [Halichoeres trimaculatus]|uniref:carcinoembryonic antigen-related cell adhesion molecule 1 n=1 Tax=Halichoeres trimaculatus TaxID=147232 RepID=UPI003D9DEFE6
MNHSSELTASDRVQFSDGNSTLTITPVNRYDQGPFRCHASGPISDGISDPFNLPVSYGPENTDLSVDPLKEHYAAGSNLSLFCSADSRPDALFTWFLNGDQLPGSGSELKLTNVEERQSGNYTCQSFNNKTLRNDTSMQLSVSVLERVTDVEVIANSTDVVEGSSVSLSCSVSSGSSLSFLWMNHSSELTASDRVQFSDGNSTLTITPVNRYDQGPFRCHASNPVSYGISDPFDLTVSYGPENTNLSVSPLQEHYAAGSDISLFCSADSRPDALFTWFLNGDQLPGSGSELKLTNMEERQSGDYTCQSFNEKTLRNDTSMQISLSVLELVSGVEVNANSIDVVEGSSVSLSCSVSSGSALSFLWMNHSSELTASDRVQLSDGNSTLTITPVNRYDQGPFRCHASNPVSYGISDPFDLTVSYGPENTNLSVSPLQEHYAAGSNISLFCSADSRPDAHFTWFLNGDQLPGSGSELKLTNVKERQSGDYTCQSFNEKSLRSDTSMELTVSVLERISGASVTPSADQAIEGNSLSLTCDAAGSVFTREWMKDGLDLTLADHMTFHEGNRVLSFKHLQKTDRGEYSCEISNPISSMEAKHNLVVNYGPENVLIRGLTETLFGDIITLTCSAESVPPATYTWSLNGTEVHDAAVYTKRFAEFSDSGTYTCDARNNITGRSQSVLHELTITERISGASLTPSTNQAIEGNSLNLTCDAAGSVFTREWMKDGLDLTLADHMTFHEEKRVLSFEHLQKTDRGEYSCEISNPINSMEAKRNLIVNYGPGNVQINGPNKIPTGDTIMLSCSAESDPSSSYTWSLNEKEIHHSAVYSKTEAEALDSGIYNCTAENNITGRTSSAVHKLTVTVEEGLSAGAIAGIVVACLLVTLFAIGGYFFYKKNGKSLTNGVGVLPNTVSAAVGGALNFTTTLSQTEEPFFSINWKFGDINIITSDVSNNTGSGYTNRITLFPSTGSLELRNLALTDSGEYRVFIVPNGEPVTAGSTRLQVYGPVSNVQVTSISTELVEFKSHVSIVCSSQGTSLFFMWWNDTSRVTASDRVQLMDGGTTFTITNVTRYDQGPFACTAYNFISLETSPDVNLSVSFGPENTNVRRSPSQEYFNEGSNMSLLCSADSRPAAMFNWFFNGEELPDTGLELRLAHINMNQSGNYSCLASNSKTLMNHMSQSLPVSVLGMTRLTAAPQT